jgi:hypothetical protein
MEPAALAIELFGVGSLAVAFAKYTLDKRNTARFEEAYNPLRRF